MNCSEKIDLVSAALVKAQKAIQPAKKDSENPFFKSRYADLAAVVDAIKDPMNDNGLAFLQLVRSAETDTVETIILHESGQYISTETKIYCNKPNDPQAFGGGITYTKRYALQAALGLPAEDDDGNDAEGNRKAKGGVRQPNDVEQKVIDKVFATIVDSTPEGWTLSKTRLAAFLCSLKGHYPNDINIAGTISSYLIKENKWKQMCIKTELFDKGNK